MISANQIRAARGLLAINQTELAERAGVGLATVKRLEASEGELRAMVQTVVAIQKALEKSGVVFIDQDDKQGPGVRLKKPLR
jgi:predicted transcriptional regulator